MTDISIIQESTVNSHLDNCTESSITSPKYVSFFDLDLKKMKLLLFLQEYSESLVLIKLWLDCH